MSVRFMAGTIKHRRAKQWGKSGAKLQNIVSV